MSPDRVHVDADGTSRGEHARDRAEDQERATRPARLAVRAHDDGFYGDWIQVDGTAEIVSLPDAMEPLVDYYRSLRGSTPTGTTTAPRWCASGASSCGSRSSAPDRTAPVERRRSRSSRGGRGSRLGGDDVEAACSSGAVAPSSPGRSTPRWRPGSRPVLVVVGYRGDEVRAALAGRDVTSWSTTADWEEGIASSLRAAIATLDPVRRRRRGLPWAWPTSRWWAPRRTARLAAAGGDGADLAVATLRRAAGQSGAGWRVASGPRPCEFDGDVGARPLMRDGTVESRSTAPTPGAPADVDTLEDLEQLQRGGPVKIEDSFRVDVPVEEAWKVLLDVERIAPCLPGAQLQEIEGDEYRGIVKIKVGPITAQYKGAAQDRARPTRRTARWCSRPRAATRAARATRRPPSPPRWRPTATAPR